MKTILYENVKSAKYPLEYDEKACLRLITATKPKTPQTQTEPSVKQQN